MKQTAKKSHPKGERVVFATICDKCDSLVGPEKVDVLTKTAIEKRVANPPSGVSLFEYKDNVHKANYRCVTTVHGCIQC